MSRSKSGLNVTFYKWIDDVKRAMRKEKELQEQLVFYGRKLLSCKTTSFDRIGSRGTSGNEKDLLYWLDRISVTKNQIEKWKQKSKEVDVFEVNLTDNEKIVFRSFFLGISNESIASSEVMDVGSVKARLIRKWFDLQG